MKPIEQMNLAELADSLHGTVYKDYIIRLRELHNLNRWISVDERWPETEDVLGKVLVYSNCGRYWKVIDTP
jgi:hypothetical protein